MPTKVVMPEMGEGVTEAIITQWLKQEGDRVEKFEALVEINTDKVDTEVPSPVAGTVLKIMHAPDSVVGVNQILCWIGEPSEEIPEADYTTSTPKAAPKPEPVQPASLPAPLPVPQPTPIPSAPPTAITTDERLKGAISPLAAKVAAEQGIDPTQVVGTGLGGMVTRQDILTFGASGKQAAPKPAPGTLNTFYSPLVRRMAAEHGIDLESLTGTGKDGRITKEDIEAAIQGGVVSTARVTSRLKPHPAYAGQTPGSVIKHTPVRRSIAKHMLESKQTSPHVSTFMEVDLSRVSVHRAANKESYARQGANLTFTAYFVAAAVRALKTYPIVNSSWSEEGVVLHPEIHIGMAVSLDADGLIVPVIKNAGRLTLLETARQVNDLANRARNKQLNPDDVRGGTFTITNHGTSGSLFATPIINQPQCGILGTGAIQKRAVVIQEGAGEAIAVRPMAYISLTFDHRILDGAIADYFLGMVKDTLEIWQ